MDDVSKANFTAEDVEKLEKEIKVLRREVNEMKELIRSLLQVLMEGEEEEDIYTYT